MHRLPATSIIDRQPTHGDRSSLALRTTARGAASSRSRSSARFCCSFICHGRNDCWTPREAGASVRLAGRWGGPPRLRTRACRLCVAGSAGPLGEHDNSTLDGVPSVAGASAEPPSGTGIWVKNLGCKTGIIVPIPTATQQPINSHSTAHSTANQTLPPIKTRTNASGALSI